MHPFLFASCVFTVAATVSAAEPLLITLTFDDGVKGHLTEVAPILESHGWAGTFNIVISRVGKDDKNLTWDEIRELKRRGFEIGNHTWSHPHLENLFSAGNTKELRHQIVDAQNVFIKELGTSPKFLCHPYIKTTPEVDALIRENGMEPMVIPRYAIMSKAKPGNWFSVKANIERELAKKGRAMPMDILFHGVSPTSGGWEAMTGPNDFAGMMDELAELEKAGKVKVVPYSEFYTAWRKKDAAAKEFAAKEAKKIRIACVGDSITFGHMLPEQQRNSYPAQLGALLDANYPDKYKVRNYGNNGRGVYSDTMRNVEKKEKRGYCHTPQYSEALKWKPHVVICMLGANDVSDYGKKGSEASMQFRKDYEDLLGEFRKMNPDVKIYICTRLTPLTQAHRNFGKPEITAMEADLDAIAADLGATPFDMYSPLQEKAKSLLFHDGIHPNTAGAKVIAEAVYSFLDK